jgi:polysaccharide biosynthesis transport protein
VDLSPDAAFLESRPDHGASRFANGYDMPEGGGWDIRGVLKRRKKLIFTVAAPILVSAVLVILAIPNTYTATSAVIFSGNRTAALTPLEGMQRTPFAPDTLASEVELIESGELLGKVVKTLNLVADPEFNTSLSAWQTTPPHGLSGYVNFLVANVKQRSQDALEAAEEALGLAKVQPTLESPKDAAQRALTSTVEAIRSRLFVAPVGVSRVIHITFSSHRPEMAAAVANAVAKTYTESILAGERSETTEAHDWIEQRLSDLRDRASRSALAFEVFKQENGIVRGKDSTINQEQLTQVSTELTQAHERRADAEALLAQASSTNQSNSDSFANVSGSALLPQLREQLSQATARLAQLESISGPNFPITVAARAQVAAITRSIGAERDRIRQGLQSKAIMARLSEERLTASLNNMKSQLGKSQVNLAQMDGLERNANADRDLYTSFVNRARQTDPGMNYQTANARVLSQATVPLNPSAPNRRLLLPAAFVLSTILGVAAALGREKLSGGLRSMIDIQNRIGLPSLGLIPFVPRSNRRLTRVMDEMTAHLLARLLVPNGGVVPRSILVTSAMPKEGKTRTATALAAAANARGLKVLLVDADLRSRSLSAAAGFDHSDRNLVQLLRGEITTREAIQINHVWNIAVLAAGSMQGSPVGLLGNGAWKETLRSLERIYDLVIIDSAPVLAAADTWILAGVPDITVFLSRWGSTPVASVELALSQLASANARIAGVALTMVPSREHATYAYGDSVLFSPKLRRYYDGPRRLTGSSSRS